MLEHSRRAHRPAVRPLHRARRLALLGLLAAIGLPSPAHAAGVVGTGGAGSCTEAALNAALTGGGTVTFNCGSGPVVIPVTSAKDLATTTTIDGTGQQIVLDGGGTSRIFVTTYRFASFTITLRNLTLRNGRGADLGGAIRLNYQDQLTTLNVEGVTFTNNLAAASGNDVGGGAIHAVSGFINIRNSVFTGNRGGNGGAIGHIGARLTIDDSTFNGNATHARVADGGSGGAIYTDGSNFGPIVIRRTSFINNVSTNLGGAMFTYQYAGASSVTIEDSYFSGNATENNGGAIYHQNGALTLRGTTFSANRTIGQGGALWLLQSNPASITNCTFVGNDAVGRRPNNGSIGLGGAILIGGSNVVTITHSTIAGNHADWVGGGITGGSSSTTLRGTIVANNRAENGGNPWNIAHNCASRLIDGGFNLQFPNRANPNDPNDQNCTSTVIIADPLLATLAANGGPTPTMALAEASPARDAVTSGCPPPSTDQRGFPRPLGARCDIGAFEGGTPALTIDDRSVPEGGAANAAFRVSLSFASPDTITVGYATADGSAVAGNDYTARSGTLTFSPGRRYHSVHVPILTDAFGEGAETFTVTLSSPTNASLARAQATGTIEPAPTPAVVPTYRAYNFTADYHFFTTSQAERDFVVGTGYRNEGTAFNVPNTQVMGSLPLFRMYNPNNGRHYYTANPGERDALMGVGLLYEKDEGFIYGSPLGGTVEVFRMYNRNSGTHLYTRNPAEKDALLANFPGVWEQHQSLGWAVP
jgi:hypothetical protein